MNPIDPIFKGCTRSAMFLGVPTIPLVAVAGFILIVSMIFNIFILVLEIPAILIMRAIVKHDDQQFRLLFLQAKFRLGYFLNGSNWKSSAYSPLKFKKRRLW